MEEDKEEVKTMVSSQPEPDIQLTNVDVKNYSSPDDLETFYVKLTELLDSSGYTLILNVRKTCIDLYQFYLEVIKRGGYHQVRKEKKWGEIVSALKLEGNNARLCTQLQKLYGKLLYKFEKLYFYRFPASQTASGSTEAKRKQGSTSSLSQSMDDGDYPTTAEISKDSSIKVTGNPEVLLETPSKDKEKKKKRGCPTGRSGYQIFLKEECARLKASGQDIDGKAILRVAVEEWNKLSDIDKQPYVEESKKMKEQKKEENNKQKGTQDLEKNEKKPNECCGDYYCVTLQPQANNPLVNNAAVDLAFKMTEKTSKDPFFPFDLDAYRSVDLLTGLAIEPK